MPKLPEVYKLNTYELPRRAGEMREYELDIEVPEKVGVELISVPVGEIIEVDARLESVTEGVLLSAEIFAVAKGECGRCLDPVELVIEKRIQELYLYEKRVERKKGAKVEDDLEIEDELLMDGNVMDLESPIRDAIVLSLPSNPLCSDECAGLCPICGGKWAELPENHAHEVIDARWAGLAALSIEEPDFKN
ncbi:MAG: DUF177 domain-containing protein [Actinomycetales bacterium]|jgi:uncharacterized protein|nr:MAG: DUF177 domain-containing protein [Actinomycetales bacterium]